jgi:hypothetical protein
MCSVLRAELDDMKERARQLQNTIAEKEGIIENTRKELAQRTEQLAAETATRELNQAELASTRQQLAQATSLLSRKFIQAFEDRALEKLEKALKNRERSSLKTRGRPKWALKQTQPNQGRYSTC